MYRNTDDTTEFSASYIPHFTNPDAFVNTKVKMLREHFKIQLSEEDIAYLREFKTENEINAAVKGIINKYWE